MRNFRYVIAVIVFMLVINKINAQYSNNIFKRDISIEAQDSNKLFFRIENTNLVKNNEYFNDLLKGGTLIGYLLQPKLVYFPTRNTKIEAGIHLQKYSGVDDYSQILPVFSFQYKINKYMDVIFGTLNGALNHNKIEPIYEFDRYIENNIESGLQFLVNSNHFEGELWFNWEKFIFEGDPFKEEFSAGISANFIVTNPESRLKIFAPIQTFFFHKGGQFDASEDALTTIRNGTYGICIDYKFQNSFFSSIGSHNYFVTYNDESHEKHFEFEKGYGFFPQVFLNTKIVNIELGYWNADKFIAPKGEILFQSMSKNEDYYEAKREIITAKFIIHKQIFNNINFGFRFEDYYDIINNDHAFCYGLHICFNRDFFLTTIRNKQN